jgi:DNA-binding transcriptional LysR family regulator
VTNAFPNIRHLAAFVATVESGSATRASQTVNLTQPALTQAIARLEKDLECALFEREPSGMRPTDPALLLEPFARRALELIGSTRVTSTQVQAFLAVARAGSYAAAAQRTGLAAASLHRAVNDLSAALGQRLVERRGRHLALTRRGEARARNLGLATAELRSGFSEVATWMGKAGSRIVIGAMPLSRARWLPCSLQQFTSEYPRVAIEIVEGSFGELVKPLRDGDIDILLGATREEKVLDDLDQEALFVDRPQVIMRASHPLMSLDKPDIEDLLGYPWILPSPETPLRQYWDDMVRQTGEEPSEVTIECGSVLTIRELLLESDSLTLLSPDQLRVELEARLMAQLPPTVPVERTIGMIFRRGWHPTSTQQAMLSILRQTAQNL